MIILGLGTNLGDKLANLRKAITAIQNTKTITVEAISPVYISDAMLPENAPIDWDMPYLNIAIRCKTTLSPHELLYTLKEIEKSFGRQSDIRHWGPRVIDIDILAFDDVTLDTDELTIPKKDLALRPFALWPLADIAPLWLTQDKTAAEIVEAWGSRFAGNVPFRTRQIFQRIEGPQLIGVINITPDSYSDGGKFFSVESALQQALQLVESGAEILDLGAESTCPTATAIDDEVEWQRLAPVLSAIVAAKNKFLLPPKISIDTRHAKVAERAIAIHADWINDVSGLDDPLMREIVAQSKKDCVVMHHLSIPERRTHVLPRSHDPLKLVYEWGEARIKILEQSGILREKIIFDPGIGFGKMAEQSMLLLQSVEVFKQLGVRLMIGHSRKTFLSLITDLPFHERDVESLAITLQLAKKEVDYLRVHNVHLHARGLKAFAML